MKLLWLVILQFWQVSCETLWDHKFDDWSNLYTPRATADKEYIIEEMILLKPREFIKLMNNEADRLWRSPNDTWQTHVNTSNLTIQSKSISGPLSVFNSPVIRAFFKIEETKAKELINFLLSPPG